MPNKTPSFLRRARRALLLLAGLLLSASCEHEPTDSTGGETHFLRACRADDDSCGSGLRCLCGVCTEPCTASASCTAFAPAVCAPPSAAASCADFQGQGHCEVQCLSDDDCTALSPSHRCQAGVCRAAGLGACARGQITADQLLIVGDSFFGATHEITSSLQTLARAAGALASNASYRDVSSIVDNTLASAGNGISDQYTSATVSAPAKVVIMNGGGADVITASCSNAAACPALTAAASAAQALLSKMAADGVQNVVYVFYPNPLDTDLQAKMDALRPLVQSACAGSAVPCQWLDLRPTFAGQYASYIQADGLDPTAAGSAASAAAIWTTMQQSCIAQ